MRHACAAPFDPVDYPRCQRTCAEACGNSYITARIAYMIVTFCLLIISLLRTHKLVTLQGWRISSLLDVQKIAYYMSCIVSLSLFVISYDPLGYGNIIPMWAINIFTEIPSAAIYSCTFAVVFFWRSTLLCQTNSNKDLDRCSYWTLIVLHLLNWVVAIGCALLEALVDGRLWRAVKFVVYCVFLIFASFTATYNGIRMGITLSKCGPSDADPRRTQAVRRVLTFVATFQLFALITIVMQALNAYTDLTNLDEPLLCSVPFPVHVFFIVQCFSPCFVLFFLRNIHPRLPAPTVPVGQLDGRRLIPHTARTSSSAASI